MGRALMRDEKCSDFAQKDERAGPWSVVAGSGLGPPGTRLDDSSGDKGDYLRQPLTPLSFDTVLTERDIQRLMRIVSAT